jgi:Family of unknown function (DUF5996)
MAAASTTWPPLPYEEWRDTYATLHRWVQIVGKIRLARTPWINHSWHVTLYPTACGLTTSPIPDGARTFQIDFDFIDHRLAIATSDGTRDHLDLVPRTVADFHDALMRRLATLGIAVRIHERPNEIEDAIPFPDDREHRVYEADHAQRWWRIAAESARVLQRFRARYIGKCSPVHFFWGSFDLAVTRFSGRPAPPHPGGVPNLPDWVAREAYSHEVSSLGFWPGGGPTPFPMFYSYAYPEPPGFAEVRIRPSGASYHPGLREFVLPYDDMRASGDPDAALLAFAESSYAAAADLARWDRPALERDDLPSSASRGAVR